MQLAKIIWEDALNVARSAENESDGACQVQITTQLKKLNYRCYKHFSCHNRIQ